MPAERETMFYREQRWFCGDYLDVDIFPVWQKPGQRRAKAKPSSEVQAAVNERRSREYGTRLGNLNFSTRDIVMHLTFANGFNPETEPEARRAAVNYLRRIKQLRKKLGLDEVRYMYTIERGKKSGRWHIHIIMSGGPEGYRDAAEEKWGMGRANSRRLQFDDEGIAGLAVYMTKGRDSYRRWTSSKNLIKPSPSERNWEFSRAEVREAAEDPMLADSIEKHYEGWTVVYAEPLLNPYNHAYYIAARLKRSVERPRR